MPICMGKIIIAYLVVFLNFLKTRNSLAFESRSFSSQMNTALRYIPVSNDKKHRSKWNHVEKNPDDYPCDVHRSKDTVFSIRCCNYMREMAFYEWEGKKRTAQMLRRIFLWMGGHYDSGRKCGGYTFMNGSASGITAHAPFRDFMNGRMGAFRHKGKVKADYMKKAATTALIHVSYTSVYSRLFKVPTCYM